MNQNQYADTCNETVTIKYIIINYPKYTKVGRILNNPLKLHRPPIKENPVVINVVINKLRLLKL